MFLIEQIAGLFGDAPKAVNGEESFRNGEWQFSITPWRLPTVVGLCEALDKVSTRDTIQLVVTIDGGSPILLTSRTPEKTAEFLADLLPYHGANDGKNTLDICFQITKTIENDCLTLYSLLHFESAHEKLSAKQLIAAFEPVCSGNKHCCIIIPPDVAQFETGTLIFTHAVRSGANIKRGELVTARKDICNFEGIQRPFLPEDFCLQERSSSQGLNNLFDRLCLIATLAFIADLSSLSDEGKFTFKLNGYRALTGEIQNGIVSAKLLNDLYKVYRWVYLDGNTSDKLGLARNIISLHWKGDVLSAPDDGIYEATLSNYVMYLTNHVNQYISLKNSLCDYLAEFSHKSTKLAESVGDKLEKNFVAFVGFLISTILLKTVTTTGFSGLLPEPLQIIAWGLIAASFVHGVISLWFSLRERGRIIEDFGLLRTRYGDLLHKVDLDRVLKQDQGLSKTTSHLDFKLRLFFIGWLVMLLICSAVVVALSHTVLPVNPGLSAPTNSVASTKPVSTSNSTGASFLVPPPTNSTQSNLASTNIFNNEKTLPKP